MLQKYILLWEEPFIEKKEDIMGETFFLDIWDTAGQERYHSIAPIYFRNADIGIFMFDVHQSESFLSLRKWKAIFDNVASENSVCILVGNKIDLENKINVPKDYESTFGYIDTIIYTSTKTGEGVQTFYKKMLDEVVNRKKKPLIIDLIKEIERNQCNCII
jgi:small GTP-binding protein